MYKGGWRNVQCGVARDKRTRLLQLFQRSISFKDKYYVCTITLKFRQDILWPYVYENRLARKLERDRLYLDYLEVLHQQECD